MVCSFDWVAKVHPDQDPGSTGAGIFYTLDIILVRL
jgi:hypothetical protein